MLSEGGTPSRTKKADDTSVPTMKWQDWMKTEPDKGRLELAIEIAERKQTMTEAKRRRPYDPKPPKAAISLGDFTGHVVGFFGCGGYDNDDNPQFENSEFVPVETLVVFKKPLSDGTAEVVSGWRCFNARLRHQLVDEPVVIGMLSGKGRAGSPYEVEELPDTERGNRAYEAVLEAAMTNGWLPSTEGKRRLDDNAAARKDDDDDAF